MRRFCVFLAALALSACGPDAELAANRLTEQELADLIAFLTQ